MAQCPSCKRDWFWDWEQDAFRLADGAFCKELENNQLVLRHCFCNRLLHIDVIGVDMYCEPVEWRNVDWCDEQNDYRETYP